MNGASGMIHGIIDNHGQPKGGMDAFVQSEAAIFNLIPETQAWINQLSGNTPSKFYIRQVDKLIRQLIEDNNWSQLDRFWIFASEIESNGWVSIVNPSGITTGTWPTNLLKTGSPPWTQNIGYKGIGSVSNYLNTNYNPSTQATNFSQNSGTVGLYVNKTILENASDMAAADGSTGAGININTERTSTFTCAINSAIIGSGTLPNPDTGLFIAQRTTSTTLSSYINGNTYQSNVAATSTAIRNASIFILANNSSTVGGISVSTPCNKQIALAFTGGGNINQRKLYLAIDRFAKAIGFSV
jgi:hypothetical protein